MRNRVLPTLVGIAVAFSGWAMAHGNEPGKASVAVTGGEVVIDYVAPALKGRDLMALIKQPGANPWRLGADSPTTLTSPVKLKFGDGNLAPGKYVLRAYLDESGVWWLQAYDDQRNVTGKLQLKSSSDNDSQEHLVIALSGGPQSAVVTIEWGAYKLEGQFSVAE